ncbi:hypothetical protein OFY05_03585 [Pseudocitrobacter faecalis]|nr:hypothetical protein OFY05_03585 [Pseudocitrobacter faecalis]
MSIIDLRFSTKSLQQLPHPTTGCQEYRDIHCPHLRALVYPNQITPRVSGDHQQSAYL